MSPATVQMQRCTNAAAKNISTKNDKAEKADWKKGRLGSLFIHCTFQGIIKGHMD